MRRRIALVVASLLILALAYRIATRWGAAQPIAVLKGDLLTAPLQSGGALLWLEHRTDGDHLLAKGRFGSAKDLLSGRTLGGLAGAEGRVYTTRQGTGGTQLVSVGLGGGSSDLGTLSGPASSLSATPDWVVGLRSSTSALPAAPFVVAAAPAAVVWAMPAKGGSATAIAELVSTTGGAELLGVAEDAVYWLVRSQSAEGDVTAVYRRPLSGGAQETLVSVPGYQSAALYRGRLVWTAPSREFSSRDGGSAVEARPLQGGEAVPIADWLATGAQLFGTPEALYVMSRGAVWSLGGERGDQRQLYLSTPTAGPPAASGGVQYFVDALKGRRTLMGRGLSWGAKLRLCLAG